MNLTFNQIQSSAPGFLINVGESSSRMPLSVRAYVRACVCQVGISTRSHQTGHQEIRPDAVFSSHILFFTHRSPAPNDTEYGSEMNTMCLN